MRACSYHASPGGSKASVLCISLWMICLKRWSAPVYLWTNEAVEKWITARKAIPHPGSRAFCGPGLRITVRDQPCWSLTLLRAWQQPVLECDHVIGGLLAGTRR
jgi:hypothetical protein